MMLGQLMSLGSSQKHRLRHDLISGFAFLLCCWCLSPAALHAQETTTDEAGVKRTTYKSANAMDAQWIWTSEDPPGKAAQRSVYFRKMIIVPDAQSGTLKVAADDTFEAYVNGTPIGSGSNSNEMTTYDISEALRPGKNVLAFKVENRNGQSAGLAAEIYIENSQGTGRIYLTNPTWRTSNRVLPMWQSPSYRDGRWKAARNLGNFGQSKYFEGGSNTQRAESISESDLSDEIISETLFDNSPPTEEGVAKSEMPAETSLTPFERVEQQLSAEQDATNMAASVSTTPVAVPAAPQANSEEHPEFQIRAGFQVQHVIGHRSTGSLIAMAFNEFGQILASQEGGPLLLIFDSNDNDVPDAVKVCCERVQSCQGILPLNGDVYVIGDGPSGTALYRLEDRDLDGEFEFVTSIVNFQGKLGEHGPHGLALGPDGLIYVSLGNHTKINQPYSLASPHANYYEGELIGPRYEDPRGHASGVTAPGGSVMRVDTEGREIQLFAGGIRNSYDLAFHPNGELFTHDSDMESDIGTPWHRPTRLLHIASGAEYGWRSGWAKWPDYLIDTLPSVMDTGRGSPTGCVFYDHEAFPTKYRDVFFSCDWSQGEIVAYRIQRRGAGFATIREAFLQGKPLNVTDIDVGPDGALYFCTGGRGTRGNIFRVVYTQEVPSKFDSAQAGIAKAIRHPQSQSAWCRQYISSMRETMGSQWDTEIREFVHSSSNHPRERARGLELMHLVGPPPSDVELVKLSDDAEPEVRSKAIYLMGMIGNELTIPRLEALLRDEMSFVRAQAANSLLRTGHAVDLDEVAAMLNSPDRFESWAARKLIENNEQFYWHEDAIYSNNMRVFLQGSTAILVGAPTKSRGLKIVERCLEQAAGFVSDSDFIDLLRVVQLAIHRAGLKPADIPELGNKLVQEFPAGNPLINRELTRLLTFLQTEAAIAPLLSYLESDAAAEEKLHTAMHLRFIRSGWTPLQRIALLTYLESARSNEGGNNLKPYTEMATNDVIKLLTTADHDLVLDHGHEIPQTALSVLFQLPESDDLVNFNRFRDLDRRVGELAGDTFDKLRVGLVAVIARSKHAEGMAYLREVYDSFPERRPAVAMGLAQEPDGRNWDYLVRSIPLLEDESAIEVLQKLQEVDFGPEEPEHYRQVILCGLRLRDDGGHDAAQLLRHWVGTRPAGAGDKWDTRLAAWQRWFNRNYPNRPSADLPFETGMNTWTYADLVTFLEGDQGNHGNVERGRAVYEKAQCVNCHIYHGSGQNFGPDLTSVGKRFQRREILESIVYPSQIVSDQYASKTVITVDGTTVTGLVVQQPNGDQLVVPSTGKQVLVSKDDIDEVLPNKTSSMPEGLLNSLSLQEIADLFEFLVNAPPTEVTSRKTNRR